MDKQLGAESGLDAVSMINASGRGIKCIMYSAFYSVSAVMQALDRGAFGYITKDTDGKELLSALETVAGGHRYVQKELQNKMNSVSRLLTLLSKKEQEIAICLLDGMDNARIASHLYISKRTVENHMSIIYYFLWTTHSPCWPLFTERFQAASRHSCISFNGGIGKIGGAAIGVVIFTGLTYCLTFLGIDTNLQFVFKGFIIIAAVALDSVKYLKKK